MASSVRRRFAQMGVAVVPSLAFVLAAACDGPEREDVPRTYTPPPPDAADEAAVTPPRDAAVVDAPTVDGAPDAEAPVEGVRAIATGSGEQPDLAIGSGSHSCAIAGRDKGVYCWGANDHGQLGNGLTGAGGMLEDVPTATRIATDETGLPFDGADELALSAYHACARRADVAFCWGQRLTGAQAEPPSATGLEPDRTRPRAIGNFDVKRLAAGGPHTCAVKANGRVACFGHSTFNELGRVNADDLACVAPFLYPYHANASHLCSGTLVEASALLAQSTHVTAGEVHSCAVVAGKAMCWGANAAGQLGRVDAVAAELNPQQVSLDAAGATPLDQVTAIASGGGKHTCAIRQGAVVCWGLGDEGQLGADPLAVPTRAYAAAVPGLAGIVAIGVADRVSCAVKEDATLWCWGRDLATLADAGTAVGTATPTQIKGPGGVGALTGVVAVAPGVSHVCALRNDETVWCWGKNDRGQLGDGTKVDSAFPVKVLGLPARGTDGG